MLYQFFTKRSWVFFCIGAFLIPTYMSEIRLERHSLDLLSDETSFAYWTRYAKVATGEKDFLED